jgi:hypothetical protein
MSGVTGWTRYLLCPVCSAERGQPCRVLDNRDREENRIAGVQFDRPHSGRPEVR